MPNNTQIEMNFDKICAEYGMGVLSIPYQLYVKVKEILISSNNKEEFLDKSYNFENEDNIKSLLDHKLIDPLSQYKKKINNAEEDRKDKVFNELKNSLHNISKKEFETEITKALGILVEDGPFAYIIWLKAQDKEPHRAMLIQTARILQELKIINSISPDGNLKDKIEKAFLNEISTDLTKTLLVKTVLEKMLIYARYKAKAMQHE